MAEMFNVSDLLRDAGAPDARPPRTEKAPDFTVPEPNRVEPDMEMPSLNDDSQLKPAELKLRNELSKMYVILGMTTAMANARIGMAVAECADEASTAWVIYARSNLAVKRALQSIVQSSALGVLIMAHSPILMIAAEPLIARFMPVNAEADPNLKFTPDMSQFVPEGYVPGAQP